MNYSLQRAKARLDNARTDAEYEAALEDYNTIKRSFDRVIVVAKNKDFPRIS